MPLAFSFFSSKSPALSATKQLEEGAVAKWSPELPVTKSAFESSESSKFGEELPSSGSVGFLDKPISSQLTDETRIIDHPLQKARQEIALPARREQTGFAAMVVNQIENAAPPLNRRPQTPFPAAAAKLENNPIPSTHPQTTVASWHAAAQNTAEPLSYETIKEELQHEIEQVKADVFGAAMGVSALKDRLDGLESSVTQTTISAASASVTREDVQTWVSQWLDEKLSDAVERALSQAQQKLTGSLSTQDFFRQPFRSAPADRYTALNQSPIILASTPL